MDPTSFDLPPPPPTTVPFSLEPTFAPSSVTHPPYAEMIYKAIESLKEKDGSSKRAIGKFIEQNYGNVLPEQHTTLLTQHLNHLKSAGLLITVKKSYKLPSSLPPPPTVTRSDSESHLPFTPLTQKARGRPPKPKPELYSQPELTAQPVFASLEFEPPTQDEPVPPTTTTVGLTQSPAVSPIVSPTTLSAKRGRGRPPGSFRSKTLKSAGRPPKPKSVSNGLKRRGRPPKGQSQPTVIPFSAPAAVPFPSVVTDGVTVPVVRSTRPRGRPKKYADELMSVAPTMRQGRPAKLAVIGGPKNPFRRPVGRPKGAKGVKKFADEDLRKKLEHFQSKVKESLEVLKPYFDHQSPVNAVAAIQELENLATLDLKAPLRDETQQQQPEQFPEQPPPQQQLPPQEQAPLQQLPSQVQIYEQQYLQIPLQQQIQQLFQPHNLASS
ncbi:uncharacterized protein LOC131603969 [Vicia villosa]|uniref:uncharacterized protein LOC131603969 n=1 Tax=Vicia villosa TaxID=3911 RepID=UPI00273AC634|nr:uncharacterized protein LOC131603969 [Vicia villosa]